MGCPAEVEPQLAGCGLESIAVVWVGHINDIGHDHVGDIYVVLEDWATFSVPGLPVGSARRSTLLFHSGSSR